MNCKHRWVEWPVPKHCKAKLIYTCFRCNQMRFVHEKKNPDLVGQGFKEGELMNKTTGAVG